MLEKPTSDDASTTPYGSGRLHELVARIATGDHVAFRGLYAILALRVWSNVSRMLPDPVDALAVTRSTFVEVWHLAGHHIAGGKLDTPTWIAAITARRVDDRLRASDGSRLLHDDYDRHTHRELTALLRVDPVTIRTSHPTVTRVDDHLDRAT